ncbi:hypothetical protein VTI74DRAFT_5438 [Chaetomium olivicolor]
MRRGPMLSRSVPLRQSVRFPLSGLAGRGVSKSLLGGPVPCGLRVQSSGVFVESSDGPAFTGREGRTSLLWGRCHAVPLASPISLHKPCFGRNDGRLDRRPTDVTLSLGRTVIQGCFCSAQHIRVEVAVCRARAFMKERKQRGAWSKERAAVGRCLTGVQRVPGRDGKERRPRES